MLRFHLDESVDPTLARALELRGVNVTTSQQIGLLGQGDDAQLAFAAQERRVLVTHDADFLAVAAKNIQHFGIAYVRVGRRSLGELVNRLSLMHRALKEDQLRNSIEYL